MAAPQQGFCCLARQATSQRSLLRLRPRRAPWTQLSPSPRTFHRTALRPRPRSRPAAPEVYIPRSNLNADAPPEAAFPHNLTPTDQDYYRNASEQEKADFRETYEALEKSFSDPGILAEIDAEIDRAAEDVERELGSDAMATPRPRLGLMNMEEDDELGDEEDEEFEGNDVSSLAHGDLEQHREIREYARIAAWEMPLLSKLATPYAPPVDKPLRFRYTTYMGETHPAAKKVVLEFCPADLAVLTPAQRLKFVKLCGVRYRPRHDLVRMSCEMFEHPAQNKRYLGDLVDALVAEAQDGADTFADVPVDFRHADMRQKPLFPPEWELADAGARERVRAEREERARAEGERTRRKGGLVDGRGLVERALRARALAGEKEAGLVLLQREEKGKGKARGSGLKLRR